MSLCYICGDKITENLTRDLKGVITLKRKDSLISICGYCGDYCYDLYRASHSIVNKSWIPLIDNAIKVDPESIPFFDWSLAAIECGYLSLDFNKSVIKVQRYYKKYKLRKKIIRTIHLCALRIDILPIEMWLKIIKYSV